MDKPTKWRCLFNKCFFSIYDGISCPSILSSVKLSLSLFIVEYYALCVNYMTPYNYHAPII